MMNTTNTRQHIQPLLYSIEGKSVSSWEPIHLNDSSDLDYNESWVQNILDSSPELLPIDEIEPAFSAPISLCREMQTRVGPVDNVFINSDGLLTIVECKLWKNPEARRKVIGQILDYAQQISRWNYSDLDNAIIKASSGKSLWQKVAEAFSLTDEAAFIDKVQHHLSNGTFLLLVVGDGIRSNTEEIANFMTRHAGLSFSFGLLEMALFKHPKSSEILICPRLLCKTVEIGRLIVKADRDAIIEQVDPPLSQEQQGHEIPQRTLTEELFIESVAGTSHLAEQLRRFFGDIKSSGLSITSTSRGISLKITSSTADGDELNLFTLNRNGTVRNHGCGNIELGVDYLNSLAKTFPNSKISHENSANGWGATITDISGSLFSIDDLVKVKHPWLELANRIHQKHIQNQQLLA